MLLMEHWEADWEWACPQVTIEGAWSSHTQITILKPTQLLLMEHGEADWEWACPQAS
jgi:hypothetical protein